ncbi:capsid cement protein [Glaesserella sp.]|uniref:capsid cement protein n=1 Tax=Glaesserella sp. TaxID=2094731 RepID=UPI0035A15C5F
MKQIYGFMTAFLTTGAIAGYRIVAHGEAEGSAKQAVATTDKLLGISTRVPKEPGEHVDVVRSGLAPVVYGTTLKRGDFITTDAQGRAVKAENNQMYVGIVEEDGEADDIGSVFITLGIYSA